VVFVCENNGYGEYTPMDVVTAGGIQPRVAAMNLPTRTVDGMDVWSVHAAAAEVTDLVRGGSGPQFVEAITYRFVGHSRSDPGKYRPPGELEKWRERDPLVVAANRLKEQYGLDDARLDAIRTEVDDRLERLEQEALAAPFPEPAARAEFAGQT
jgi:acetoin:2,6-dichlorophenolindophenol oxidoreductase subunit alpha